MATDRDHAAAAFGRDLPKRKHHLTVFEKLEQAEAKIRQAHKRASRAAPQRLDEEWGRAPGVSAAEQPAGSCPEADRAYCVWSKVRT